jgi:hypothetical protein
MLLPMGDLAKVLDLLQNSPDRWDSVRMAGREWRNVTRLTQAWEHSVSVMGGNSIRLSAFQRDTDEAEFSVPEETVEKWRFWKKKPDLIRTQFQVGNETATAVFVGPQWWSRTPGMGLITNGGSPHSGHGLGPAEGLVDTPSLLSVLRVDDVSNTTFLSRPAYVATAKPANLDEQLSPFVLHALGVGADRYELVIDAEVGIVLRSQADVGGEAFRILEVEEFGIDEVLAESLFSPASLSS